MEPKNCSECGLEIDPLIYPECVIERGICTDCFNTLEFEDRQRIYGLSERFQEAAWKVHDQKFPSGCDDPDPSPEEDPIIYWDEYDGGNDPNNQDDSDVDWLDD